MAETRIRQRIVETNGVTYAELAFPANTSQFLRADGNWVTAGGGGGGGASAISVSAGTTSASLNSVVFSNSNGVSFGLNGSTITGSHNGLTSQSNQALSAGNGSFAFQTASFSNANGVSFSTSAGSAIVASHNGLTSQSNQALSAANGSFTFQTATFANSNGISFSTGTQGLFASHNGITSQSNQQMTAFAVSNTTQSSSGTFNASSLQFAGAGGVSVGVSNGSVVISGAAGGAGGSVNFSAGTTSGNLASVVFSNSNGVSFGLNGSTITASAAGGGGGAPVRSYIEIMQGERMTSVVAASATQWSRRPIFMPFWLDGTGIQCKTVRFIGSGVGSSNRSLNMSLSVGIYFATNSTQLSLLASDSQGFQITASSQSSLWNGGAVVDFTGMSALTLTTEGRYVLALDISASSHNATFASFQFWGGDPMPAFSRFLVGGTTSATNNTSHIFPFWGVYSTTTGGMPSTVAATQINGGNSASLADLYAVIKQI